MCILFDTHIKCVSICLPFHLYKHLWSCTCVPRGCFYHPQVQEIILLVRKDNGDVNAPYVLTSTF